MWADADRNLLSIKHRQIKKKNVTEFKLKNMQMANGNALIMYKNRVLFVEESGEIGSYPLNENVTVHIIPEQEEPVVKYIEIVDFYEDYLILDHKPVKHWNSKRFYELYKDTKVGAIVPDDEIYLRKISNKLTKEVSGVTYKTEIYVPENLIEYVK